MIILQLILAFSECSRIPARFPLMLGKIKDTPVAIVETRNTSREKMAEIRNFVCDNLALIMKSKGVGIKRASLGGDRGQSCKQASRHIYVFCRSFRCRVVQWDSSMLWWWGAIYCAYGMLPLVSMKTLTKLYR